MRPLRHIGVVTAGGDCPGMNAALRAIVKSAVHRHGLQVTGFLDGYAGLLADQSRPLGIDDVSGILTQGGTILGASNRDDPFHVPVQGPTARTHVDRSDAAIATLARHDIDALVVIGGDGSLSIAQRLGTKGSPHRRHSEDHRQRRVGHGSQRGLRFRPFHRDRGRGPAALDRRLSSPDHGPRAHGSQCRLDRAGSRNCRRRRRHPDPRDSVPL